MVLSKWHIGHSPSKREIKKVRRMNEKLVCSMRLLKGWQHSLVKQAFHWILKNFNDFEIE